MSDIFREVDEALQREKAAQFWKKHGATLVIFALILIGGTGLTTAYRVWNENRNAAETSRLINAVESTDGIPALEKLAGDTRPGPATIARMNAAARLAADKKFADASKLYEQVADDTAAPADLRDLATILYVQSVQQTNAAPDYKALAEKLKKAANSKSGAFALKARLESALLYGDGLKDYASALKMLDGFEAPSVPASLQEKARALKHVYTYEQAKTAPAAK